MTVPLLKITITDKTPLLKLAVISKPFLSGRMDVRFPANIRTNEFLTHTRENGGWAFGVDYSLLMAGPVTDPTTAYIAVQDRTSGFYRVASLASLLASGLDIDLQAIAALTGTGILSRTADGLWALRTLIAPAAGFTIANPAGVAGNQTFALANDLAALEAISGSNVAPYRTGVDAWSTMPAGNLTTFASLTAAADKLPYFNGGGTPSMTLTDFTAFARTLLDDASQAAMQATLGLVPGTNVQAFDSDLAALAANAGTGIWCVTGPGAGSVRALVVPPAGISVANSGGVGGNIILALANDLAALEGLAGTGLARRTGTDAWSVGDAVTNAELATMAAWTIKGNATAGSATPTDITIGGLVLKPTLAAADLAMIQDAASGELKSATISSITASSVPAVRYDVAQTLTAGEKTQAQSNIDAVSKTGNQTITGGYSVAPANLGTASSFTVTPASGNYQYFTRNSALTITAPASDCAVDYLMTNGASASTLTFSGFTVGALTGDPLTNTSGSKFLISVRRINSVSTYLIKALQ